MTATPLSVMMNFFAPETDSYSFICNGCGSLVEITAGSTRNKRKLCDECRTVSVNQRASNYHFTHDINENTKTVGDPSLDLVLAVIRQAKTDRWKGWHPKQDKEELSLQECDPVEFLAEGAELWLRCAGINIDLDIERNLRKLTDKRNNRRR